MINGNLAAQKIKERPVLKTILDGLRADGKTIVFTNGCFDLLHVGHIRYLEEARALGDCLVVGMNSDNSVKRLKGPNRPLVPEIERAEVLAALDAVDYVTIFPEDTPITLISTIRPDIHVKGGDYRVEDLGEAPAVEASGGRVVIVPFTEGRSTTRLVERIINQVE